MANPLSIAQIATREQLVLQFVCNLLNITLHMIFPGSRNPSPNHQHNADTEKSRELLEPPIV